MTQGCSLSFSGLGLGLQHEEVRLKGYSESLLTGTLWDSEMGGRGATFLGSDTIPNREIKGAPRREAPARSSQAHVWGQCLALATTFLSVGSGRQGGPDCGPSSRVAPGAEAGGWRWGGGGAVTTVWNFLLDRCKV